MLKFVPVFSVVTNSSLKTCKKSIERLPIDMFSHLVSNKHKKSHRLCYGGAIGVVGVVMAKTLGHCEVFAFQIFGDYVGFALHAIGWIPVIDHYTEKIKESRLTDEA